MVFSAVKLNKWFCCFHSIRKPWNIIGNIKFIRSCSYVRLLLLDIILAGTEELFMVEETHYTNSIGLLLNNWLIDTTFAVNIFNLFTDTVCHSRYSLHQSHFLLRLWASEICGSHRCYTECLYVAIVFRFLLQSLCKKKKLMICVNVIVNTIRQY